MSGMTTLVVRSNSDCEPISIDDALMGCGESDISK